MDYFLSEINKFKKPLMFTAGVYVILETHKYTNI